LELSISLLWENATYYNKFEIIFLDFTFEIVQKPLGLLSLLDEESTFPNGTDLTFANKLKQHLNSNSCFKGEREKAFTVCHYAGEV